MMFSDVFCIFLGQENGNVRTYASVYLVLFSLARLLSTDVCVPNNARYVAGPCGRASALILYGFCLELVTRVLFLATSCLLCIDTMPLTGLSSCAFCMLPAIFWCSAYTCVYMPGTTAFVLPPPR